MRSRPGHYHYLAEGTLFATRFARLNSSFHEENSEWLVHSAKSEIYGDREIRTEENRRTNRRSACELGIVPASRTYPGRSVGRSSSPPVPDHCDGVGQGTPSSPHSWWAWPTQLRNRTGPSALFGSVGVRPTGTNRAVNPVRQGAM